MYIHEIQQYLTVKTPLGNGRAMFLIDYGPEVNTVWVVALNKNGQIKHFDSNQIQLTENFTFETYLKKK